ncbi:PilZ domain-containing protein [Methylomarinum sp. Ch1-1]|uniref:PilZ domain-containing protein n=1 Tax=Methylomarinum roseum TaxID=3067653 RepID=A0AAU7NQH6_9GAMM|nr:PilZ domain-containing protein [Methylomarinum sp. Ch1-1]MDP4521168.1 PilZ domain-containing protein [Methylomarinum sp. Ch1-1]
MEKRVYPRVAANFSAVIANEDGIKLKVMAMDASSEGLCVECNTIERNLVTPGGNFVRDGKPVELFVWLDLPDENGGTAKIEARCHVAFSRRIANDRCKIGMRYLNLEKKAYEKLIRFIEYAMASND